MPVHAAAGVTRTVECGAGAVCSDGRLQNAISASIDGDTVLVYPGTYRERIDFHGASVRVMSANGPSATTIDGDQSGTVVRFAQGESRSATLQGFTVQHGNASGIVIEGGASPTIAFDIVTANSACANGAGISVSGGSPLIAFNVISANFGGAAVGCGGYLPGGGIFASDSTATIASNRITDNSMDSGAGIAVRGGAVTVNNNIVQGNNNFGRGGASGLELFDSASGTTVTQNLFARNKGTGRQSSVVRFATLGSVSFVNNTLVSYTEVDGLWIDSSSAPPSLINNIIVGGRLTPIACGSAYAVNPYLSHNEFWGGAPTGVCARLVFANSNIGYPPHFVNGPAGNYRETASSRSVDAGELSDATHPFSLPLKDLDGRARIRNNTVDIGAYERQ